MSGLTNENARVPDGGPLAIAPVANDQRLHFVGDVRGLAGIQAAGGGRVKPVGRLPARPTMVRGFVNAPVVEAVISSVGAEVLGHRTGRRIFDAPKPAASWSGSPRPR